MVTQKGKAYTIITICNYASYQGCTTEEGTQGAHKGHAKGTRRATNKNEKNEKNIENTSSSSLQRKKDENDYFAVGDIMKFKLSGFEDEYFITAN